MSFILEVNKNGKDTILFNDHKYRESYQVKNGDLVWRCLGRVCKASVRTNKEKTVIYHSNEIHSGQHPVTMRALTPTSSRPRRDPVTPTPPRSAASSTPANNTTQNTLNHISSPHLDLHSENISLKEQLAELRNEMRVILDHSIESDQRLLQYTDKVFLPPLSTTFSTSGSVTGSFTHISTQTDESDELNKAHIKIQELENKLSRPCQSCVTFKEELSNLRERLRRMEANNIENRCIQNTSGVNCNRLPALSAPSNSSEIMNCVDGETESETTRKITNKTKRTKTKNIKNGTNNTNSNEMKHHKTKVNSNNETSWYQLNDDQIQSWFNHYLNIPKNTLVIPPTISHLLKMCQDRSELTDILKHLHITTYDYVMAIVNNRTDESGAEGEGDHWTLLVYHRGDGVFYHLDSTAGFNHPHAIKLANNLRRGGLHLIDDKTDVMEVSCFQQKSNVECGIHVLHNAEVVCSLIRRRLHVGNSALYLSGFSVNKYYKQIGLHKLNSQVISYQQPDCTPGSTSLNIPNVNSNSCVNSKVSRHKLVIVGDSHSRGMGRLLQPFLPQFDVITYTFPGAPMLHVIERLHVICDSLTSNDYAILVGGTNVTDFHYCFEIVLPNLTNLVKTSKVNIILTEVPYLHKISKDKYEQIKYCNQLWQTLSINYCIPYLIFSHLINAKHFVRNGSHLNVKGKTLICKTIISWFPSLSSNKETLNTHFLDVVTQKANLT